MPYHFGEYNLDADAHELRRQGEIIALEPEGFQVLLYLIQQRDRVVPRDELFAQCWAGTFVSDWALTRCLARIRKALGAGRDGSPMIKTVHGQGYRFIAPLTVDSGAAVSRPELTAALSPAASVPDSAPVALSLTEASGAPHPTGVAQLASPAAERRVLTVLCCALVDARVSTKRGCIASKESYCWVRLSLMRSRQKPVSIRPSPLPAASRQKRWSYALP
jgi:DNA-binding winged helix-turn-helix (wHTH) protein